ncbi:ATP-binding protein [uncultured Chryseobacterium sp.]|uniref:ATP-binding protein n=1 Tax=uncultured Chryseobacterium sp. TaxID=259322 RepID=UPI00374954D7
MSQMLASISRIVTEDISSRVNQYDVIFELITNSIHANATDIKCYLNTNDNPFEGDEYVPPKLNTIRIVDNGDGLTDKNYNSFSTYRSEYKKDLGCKGVGRFVLLKVYEFVNYSSYIPSVGEIRKFKFDFDFDTDHINKSESDSTEKKTEVSLNYINKTYYDFDKKIDRRILLDIDDIRNKVLMNLIPTLFFYQKKGVNVNIHFINEFDGTTVKISPEDIPDFTNIPFEIKNYLGNSILFNLNYKISNNIGNLNAYYCANNRTVCEFHEKDLKISMPYGYSGFMLLESEYLDERSNNERNDFDIFPVKKDMYSTLSWDTINNEIKKIFGELVKDGVPETEKINKEKLREIHNERPYLTQYIESEDIDLAGFLDKRHIIDKAKKKFDNAKEKVLTNSGKASYTDTELNEAIQLTQNELVSYVNDRVIVIERLKSLVDKGEKVESIIHNMFMERYTKDDYFSVGKNNLWLLDDRFTTYSYAASDRRINDVLQDIDLSKDEIDILNDKPDLSLFFSHNPLSPDRLKSVLIELKPFEYKNKSHRKKHQGILQLIEYLKAFKSREKIDEVYGYLITDIDHKFAEALLQDDFIPLFSSEHPIYHRNYDKIGVSVFVVSAKTLIYDAEARNRTFLDIIRKQAKINFLLKEEEEKEKLS